MSLNWIWKEKIGTMTLVQSHPGEEDREFELSDDPEADMLRIKRYFQPFHGRYPENFVTGLE